MNQKQAPYRRFVVGVLESLGQWDAFFLFVHQNTLFCFNPPNLHGTVKYQSQGFSREPRTSRGVR